MPDIGRIGQPYPPNYPQNIQTSKQTDQIVQEPTTQNEPQNTKLLVNNVAAKTLHSGNLNIKNQLKGTWFFINTLNTFSTSENKAFYLNQITRHFDPDKVMAIYGENNQLDPDKLSTLIDELSDDLAKEVFDSLELNGLIFGENNPLEPNQLAIILDQAPNVPSHSPLLDQLPNVPTHSPSAPPVTRILEKNRRVLKLTKSIVELTERKNNLVQARNQLPKGSLDRSRLNRQIVSLNRVIRIKKNYEAAILQNFKISS